MDLDAVRSWRWSAIVPKPVPIDELEGVIRKLIA